MNSSVRNLLMLSAVGTLSIGLSASSEEPKKFPQGFDWCVATAGHQIEGDDTNGDWWDWEQVPGNIERGERSGKACDSYHRTERDLSVLEQLHTTAYRFSIEWSRIEPEQGTLDEEAIEHYRSFIEQLGRRGIRPIITLQHFVMPRWLRKLGGWEWSGTPGAFGKFARLVRERIAPQARDFVTVNEPMVNVLGGYYLGNVPPGEKRAMKDVAPVLVGLLRAHAAAYRALHSGEGGDQVRVGMAHHLRVFSAERALNPLDHLVAHWMDGAWNWALPDALETGVLKVSIPGVIHEVREVPEAKGTQDYVGINYYTREKVNAGVMIRAGTGHPTAADSERVARMYLPANWEVYPQGLEELLLAAHKRYNGKPTLITENGVDDAKDVKRPDYLRGHLEAVHRAIEKGVDVRGYCHWSMADNFEWIHGFTPRFGLFETDYNTYELKPRASAALFSRFATENALR